MNDVNLNNALEKIHALEIEIAEYKKIEDKLKQERDFSTRLIENAPVVIVILNKEGKIVRFNHYVEKLTGYSIDEVKGKDWFSTLLPEDQREKTKKVFLSAIDDIQTNGNVNPLLTKDGAQRVIEWHNKTLKDTQNNTIGLLCIGLDITESQRAEQELYESKEKFRVLVESTSDWIWEVDSKGAYTYVSQNIEVLLGYKSQEIIGKSPFDLMPAEEAQRVGNIFKEFLDKCVPFSAIKNINICKDGSLKILETSGVPFFNQSGQLLGYRGIDRDITEREHAEQNLYESEEKFRTITSSAQDAIFMMDCDGKISYWNKAAEKIFGYSQKEAIGQILHTFITPKRFLAAHKIGFSHFKKTGEGAAIGKMLELTALRKDGTEFPIELSLSAVKKNNQWNAIGVLRDITERKAMEKELRLKEEMMLAQAKQAAMGDMIAMISHHWRQPLAVIGFGINELILSIALGEEITTNSLESLNKEVEELAEIISKFSDYFRPNQSPEQTTLEDVLKSTLDIIGANLENEKITLNIKNSSKSHLFIVKSSLIQVLINILVNAKEVLLSNKIEQAVINITIDETKEAITISICDNAGGIPEFIIDKIGQPYFTTKKELNGVGLGLYISRTIVEKHLCGTLTWHNEDKGACFVITLLTNNLFKQVI
ncbi:MAG: PAS domain S-box protein [Sulfurimonas sp.]|jgi:PAS domain S-box-containing protein